MSFTGLKVFWAWIKAHPAWAAVIFLILLPFVFLGLLARVRNWAVALPGVGPLLGKLPQIGA